MNDVNIRSVIFVLGVVVVLFVCCISCGKVQKEETTVKAGSVVDNSNRHETNNDSGVLNSEDLMNSVPVVEVDKYNKDYQKVEFPIELNDDILGLIKPVKTDEEAKAIAIAIIDELHNQGRWIDDTLVSVLHSTEDNVWRFEYSLAQGDEHILCSNTYIVIDGNKGVIIAAWAEE